MTPIRADDTNDSFAPDDLAVFAKFFYGCANFHKQSFSIISIKNKTGLRHVERRHFQSHARARRQSGRPLSVAKPWMGQHLMAVGQSDPEDPRRNDFD